MSIESVFDKIASERVDRPLDAALIKIEPLDLEQSRKKKEVIEAIETYRQKERLARLREQQFRLQRVIDSFDRPEEFEDDELAILRSVADSFLSDYGTQPSPPQPKDIPSVGSEFFVELLQLVNRWRPALTPARHTGNSFFERDPPSPLEELNSMELALGEAEAVLASVSKSSSPAESAKAEYFEKEVLHLKQSIASAKGSF
jgi:hypothetical protein